MAQRIQKNEMKPLKKSTLSINLLGSSFPLGLSYSHKLTDRDKLELGVGLAYLIVPERPSFGFNYKRYLSTIETNKAELFVGVGMADILSAMDSPGPFIHTPIGISYEAQQLFTEIYLAPTTLPSEGWLVSIYGGLSLGITF